MGACLAEQSDHWNPALLIAHLHILMSDWLSLGRLPNHSWKYPSALPQNKWLHQLWTHNKLPPAPVDLWRNATSLGPSALILLSLPTAQWRQQWNCKWNVDSSEGWFGLENVSRPNRQRFTIDQVRQQVILFFLRQEILPPGAVSRRRQLRI